MLEPLLPAPCCSSPHCPLFAAGLGWGGGGGGKGLGEGPHQPRTFMEGLGWKVNPTPFPVGFQGPGPFTKAVAELITFSLGTFKSVVLLKPQNF